MHPPLRINYEKDRIDDWLVYPAAFMLGFAQARDFNEYS